MDKSFSLILKRALKSRQSKLPRLLRDVLNFNLKFSFEKIKSSRKKRRTFLKKKNRKGKRTVWKVLEKPCILPAIVNKEEVHLSLKEINLKKRNLRALTPQALKTYSSPRLRGKSALNLFQKEGLYTERKYSFLTDSETTDISIQSTPKKRNNELDKLFVLYKFVRDAVVCLKSHSNDDRAKDFSLQLSDKYLYSCQPYANLCFRLFKKQIRFFADRMVVFQIRFCLKQIKKATELSFTEKIMKNALGKLCNKLQIIIVQKPKREAFDTIIAAETYNKLLFYNCLAKLVQEKYENMLKELYMIYRRRKERFIVLRIPIDIHEYVDDVISVTSSKGSFTYKHLSTC